MKVEIWSDIGCPFCYIGKRRFEEGLEKFANKNEVKVEYRSFQLDPNAEKNPSHDLYDMLVKKMGRSRGEVMAMNQQLADQAQSVGLDLRFDQVIPANSLDAHRIIKLADDYGKGEEVLEHLYKAYFTEGKHIGDADTLADIAVEAGIAREKAIDLLNSTQYTSEVQADGQEASRFGATGVPFFVINRKYAISGAQPSELFLEALQKVWDEEHPPVKLESLNQESGDVCEDGFCAPKKP